MLTKTRNPAVAEIAKRTAQESLIG